MYSIEKEYERYIHELGGRIISSADPRINIKEARTSIGMTQEDLGNLLDLRRETISRIENGTISPTTEFIRKFTKIIAVAKVLRDLYALDEVTRLKGLEAKTLTPNILRLYLNISLRELRIISEIESKGYQKTRTKILRKIKTEV